MRAEEPAPTCKNPTCKNRHPLGSLPVPVEKRANPWHMAVWYQCSNFWIAANGKVKKQYYKASVMTAYWETFVGNCFAYHLVSKKKPTVLVTHELCRVCIYK